MWNPPHLLQGALAWNGEQLSSGSRDRVILQRDVRTPPSAERRLQGHRQEVCGLKWSPDHQHLASGGNDNKVTYIYIFFFKSTLHDPKKVKVIILCLLLSYWCGTAPASSLCSSTVTTWRQWRPSPGLHTNTGCWRQVVALPTAACAFGTRWRVRPCRAQTPAHRSAIWPGPNTLTSWWGESHTQTHTV